MLTEKLQIVTRIYKQFDPSFSLICYYSFILNYSRIPSKYQLSLSFARRQFGTLDFCVMKLLENTITSTTTSGHEERKKINAVLESLEFLKLFDVCLTEFRNNRFLLCKYGNNFLFSSELFIG
jgi:hypothetical protein